MIKTDEIREKYLAFFEKKKHTRVQSDSLVPAGDPTLLFTGAGMNQFKDYFLGLKKDMTRATSSQKCIRTGDLENVGRTAYHHSFFEMLGNFSFGDYFKEEAIVWAWEFLTEELGVSSEHLRVTVHHTDDEAYAIWRNKIGIREDWIYKMGDESNFWPANAPKDGPNGPCGPCSEIYYDNGVENAKEGEDPEDIESKRFAEIWNLVFTQFDRQEDGTLAPLANKNIDTGMGLERLACVLQGKNTNFEIDLFEPIIESVKQNLGVGEVSAIQTVYAIVDHVRAVTFAIADGVIPSNESRGYVIRKLIRRSLWHATQLLNKESLDEAFLYKVVPSVVEAMKAGYPELTDSEKSIQMTIKAEEERFLSTLETGLSLLSEKLRKLDDKNLTMIPGEDVFELYDTYGFPEELTRMIGEKRGFSVDAEKFEELMDKQRETAKGASKILDRIFVSSDLEKEILALPATNFVGYQSLSKESKVQFVSLENKEGLVVTESTPCYAESGGQVGDKGTMTGEGFEALILDTYKKDVVFVHVVKVLKGSLQVGDALNIVVDAERRGHVVRNHTATHLLHAALRLVLGEQVRQMGSLVAEDRLRFDFSYANSLTREQIVEIERLVNQEILKNTSLSVKEKSIEEAREEGAMAFFGEKYGDSVRVVDVPGFSKELCGGTHCEGTGQIGSFVILSESSVASGTRRIEAVTGSKALDYFNFVRSKLDSVAGLLKSSPDQVEDRVRKLKETVKKLEKGSVTSASAEVNVQDLLNASKDAGSHKVLVHYAQNMDMKTLRQVSDQLKQQGQGLVYLLIAVESGKASFVLGLSKDIEKSGMNMKDLVSQLKDTLGVSGGGRPDMVQGGGPAPDGLESQLNNLTDLMIKYVEAN